MADLDKLVAELSTLTVIEAAGSDSSVRAVLEGTAEIAAAISPSS